MSRWREIMAEDNDDVGLDRWEKELKILKNNIRRDTINGEMTPEKVKAYDFDLKMMEKSIYLIENILN